MYVSYTTSDFSKRLRLFLSAGTNLREREKLFIKLPKGRTYQNWKEIPESISLLKKKKQNKTKTNTNTSTWSTTKYVSRE